MQKYIYMLKIVKNIVHILKYFLLYIFIIYYTRIIMNYICCQYSYFSVLKLEIPQP